MKAKALVKGFLVSVLTINSWAEPGGTYTLTGNEKSVEEIIKADMKQFPEYYEGESLKGYIRQFKTENQIGKRTLKPGDELRFPETRASLKLKKPVAEIPMSAGGDDNRRVYAEISCEADFGRFKNGYPAYGNVEENFADIPDTYRKAKISMCNIGFRDPLVFHVTKAGLVTLVTDNIHAHDLEVDKWTKTGEVKKIGLRGAKFKLQIYEKHLEIGEYTFARAKGKDLFGVRLVIFPEK